MCHPSIAAQRCRYWKSFRCRGEVRSEEAPHPFNLWWLAYMNQFIGLPWLLGLGIGGLWLRYADRDGPPR